MQRLHDPREALYPFGLELSQRGRLRKRADLTHTSKPSQSPIAAIRRYSHPRRRLWDHRGCGWHARVPVGQDTAQFFQADESVGGRVALAQIARKNILIAVRQHNVDVAQPDEWFVRRVRIQ